MPRTLTARYADPLDQIWEHAAARLGLRLRRDAKAYASSDGKRTLSIAPPEDLDGDDCLAQIVLHELCHALVEGEDSFHRPDWGLECDEAGAGYDAVREQACLRTQAALLRRHGLRRLLAPTTDFRAFYDRLPEDPLSPLAGGDSAGDSAVDSAGVPDPGIALARQALGRAARPPYDAVLGEALQATAAMYRIVGRIVGTAAASASASSRLPSLWGAPAALHPAGFCLPEVPLPLPSAGDPGAGAATCGTCAWRFSRPGSAISRCRRAPGARIDPKWLACVLYEGPLSCQACAACCRHAYDLVPLGKREPVRRLHPHLVEAQGDHLRRDSTGQRCAALTGPAEGPYACSIYADRPRTCRDFPQGGTTCLEARRRVGLSL